MENQKELSSNNRDARQPVEFEAAIKELNEYFTQIWSINNILHFLYDFLSDKRKEISTPASVMITCMWQLDYIYYHAEELLENIVSYGFEEQTA